MFLANGVDPPLTNEKGDNVVDAVKRVSNRNKAIMHPLYSQCAALSLFDQGRLKVVPSLYVASKGCIFLARGYTIQRESQCESN